ncbi:MAG: hypothetical protein HS108_06640 [Planctomycetes bacterium]|nr:hypothetical protein [Planctomycetota bacterium]MCL4731052.1 hypothetical protein [Planctomycetota bacterium]
MTEPLPPQAARRIEGTDEAQAGLVTIGTDTFECPLCAGRGRLGRLEFFEKTGMREPSLIAELSAKKAVESMHTRLWGDFRAQLAEQVTARTKKLDEELLELKSTNRRLEDKLAELQESHATDIAQAKKDQANTDKDAWLKERETIQQQLMELQGQLEKARVAAESAEEQRKNAVASAVLELKEQLNLLNTRLHGTEEKLKLADAARAELEKQLSATAVQGRVEERAFADIVAEIPGIWISDKLKKYGDYLVRLRGPDGQPLEGSTLVVDNKDKEKFTPEDITKLVRDAQHHQSGLAVLVGSEESCFRREDYERRFDVVSGVALLRTTRQWFVRDLDLLRPLMRKQADEGPEFMKRNQSLAATIQSFFKEIDAVDASLGQAETKIAEARKGLKSYKEKVVAACALSAAGGGASAG